MAFSEVDNTEASQATSINAVAQQISAAPGIAVAGGVLDISSAVHGGELQLGDFHLAFFVVTGISALSLFTFARLSDEAGAALTKRHSSKEKPA